MTLNRNIATENGLLDTAFRLAHGHDVPEVEAAALPDELREVAMAYASGDHAANVAPLQEEISALDDMIWYLRIESALAMLFRKQIRPAEFLTLLNRPGIPPYLINYYRGIGKYGQGKVQQALHYFSKARPGVENMVVEYGRYVDGSIRGVVSARSFEEFEQLAASASDARTDSLFPYILDATPAEHDCCHIIGCDEGYWRKYRDLFVTWAKPLSQQVDIWINCTNFSPEMIADVRQRAPFARVSIDFNDFANKMPYYTMTRFILAEKLAREGRYDRLVCTDIDILVQEDRYGDFIATAPAGGSAIYRRGRFPWRSSAAVFSIWRGEEGRRLLRWLLAYYCDAYRPEISGHNRQWWIDQYIISILAEVAAGAYPQWKLEPICFTPLERSSFPILIPGQPGGLSKEDFVTRYAQG